MGHYEIDGYVDDDYDAMDITYLKGVLTGAGIKYLDDDGACLPARDVLKNIAYAWLDLPENVQTEIAKQIIRFR